MSRTDGASERRSENRPALQRRYSKTKRDSPSRRAGVKRRKLLFSTKNREAWSLFSATLRIRIIFRPDGSPRPSGTGPIWNRQQPALKHRPIIKASLRDGMFSVPKRAKQRRKLSLPKIGRIFL